MTEPKYHGQWVKYHEECFQVWIDEDDYGFNENTYLDYRGRAYAESGLTPVLIIENPSSTCINCKERLS